VDAGPFQGPDGGPGVEGPVDELEEAMMAGAAIAGMGALVVRYYSTESDTERSMLRGVMKRGIELAGEVREDLAVRIINQLGESMSKKGPGR
jgi:hypothetical protein